MPTTASPVSTNVIDEQGFIKPIQITRQGVDHPVFTVLSRDIPPRFKTLPRIAMLWASIRGDSSREAMAKHDLIMTGFDRSA
jgi:hypothetical protein